MTPPPDEHSVRIEPHGRTLRLMPGQPILEAALGAGLNLPHSCKSGHCGSCRARLLAGEVGYPNGLPLGITAEQAQGGEIQIGRASCRERGEISVGGVSIEKKEEVRARVVA